MPAASVTHAPPQRAAAPAATRPRTPPPAREPAAPAAPERERRGAGAGHSFGSVPVFAPPVVGEVLRGPGRPLEPGVRAFFEPRFGRSFGDVRVHTGARASASAGAVGARAYAVGRDLVFRAGEYAPDAPEGRRLLAHELAHVAQAASGAPAVLRRQTATGPSQTPAATAPSPAPAPAPAASVSGPAGTGPTPAAAAADPNEATFAEELKKELDGGKLRPADQQALRRRVVRDGSLTDPLWTQAPPPEKRAPYLRTLAEYLLCGWADRRRANSEPQLHPDAAFCLAADATAAVLRGSAAVEAFVRDVVSPAYDTAVQEIRQDMTKRGLLAADGKGAVADQPKGLKGQNEAITFAMNLYREAGTEIAKHGLDAYRAVAQVVLNRVAAGFASDAKSAILAKSQFSWTGKPKEVADALDPPVGNPKVAAQWNGALQVAYQALSGDLVAPVPARDATFYFNPNAVPRPSWADACCYRGKVGQHCFYRIEVGQVCKERENKSCNTPKRADECG